MSAQSLLPDNPSAPPVEIMRGGGGMAGGAEPTFSADELKILTQYGLQPGGNLDKDILPPVKKQFLEQLAKSNCAIGTGDNVILNSECSAVAQVIRAMITKQIKRTNGWSPKNLKISAKPPTVPEARQPAPGQPVPGQPVQPPPVPGQRINTTVLINTIRARIDEKHNGLDNCGSTCYLNSALQMFSYIPELVDETRKNPRLYSIFTDLYNMPFKSVKLDEEANNRLSLFNGMFPQITAQQDVTEFITRFYTKFDLKVPYFKIKQVQTTTCVNPPPAELQLPDKVPVKADTESITLPLGNGNSIEALLNNIQQPAPLNGVEGCVGGPDPNQLIGPATQVFSFEIPQENRYLVISLSRFRDTSRTEKDAQGRIVPVFERINDPIEINRDIHLGGVEYQLYGTILHMGTPKGGHYVFRKIKSDFNGNILYNDSAVTEETTIPNLNVDTYVAIYRRVNIPMTAPAAAAAEPSPAPGSPAAEPAAEVPADEVPAEVPGPAAAAEPAPPAAAAEVPAPPAAGPAVVGAMPNLRLPSIKEEPKEEPEENLNTPFSNENAQTIIQYMVDMLMGFTPEKRKITSRDGIKARVKSTRAAIEKLPDGKLSGFTRENITSTGGIKTDRINHIVRNFSNYSKADLHSVVNHVNSICLATIKDGGDLNSGDDVRIRKALIFVEGLLRHLEILEYNINNHIRMSAKTDGGISTSEIGLAISPNGSSADAQGDQSNDAYYEENPSNFQPGHLRINFQKGDNRSVYANAIIRRRKTRIYGKNTANIKKRFNSRTSKLKAAGKPAQLTQRQIKLYNQSEIFKAKGDKLMEEIKTASGEDKNKKTVELSEVNKILRIIDKEIEELEEKHAIKANIAAGKPVPLKNRLWATFGGGRRTRRKTRGNRKSRRGGRK
jgi:hypothetical protein